MKLILIFTLALLGAASPLIAQIRQADPIIDSPMASDPELPEQEVRLEFNPRLETLWAADLNSGVVDNVRRAADAIAEAHQGGMKDLADQATKLEELLGLPEQHRLVRLAAARALIALDARDAADTMLAQNAAKDPAALDVALLTDPTLAKWDHQPARQVWRQRLGDPKTEPTLRRSAIEALGAVKDRESFSGLLALARDRDVQADVRLAAARAAAATQPPEVPIEGQAGELAGGDTVDRLVAVALAGGSRTAGLDAMLVKLAQDGEPSVAAAALRRLLEVDPLLVKPIGAALLKNADANVRRLTAEAVLAQVTPEAIALVGALLDDPVPATRVYVRDRFIELDKTPALSAAIRETALAATRAEGWRGQEQGALVLGKLEHDAAAPRMIELLKVNRGEVRLAASAALRWMAVKETLPQVLAHAEDLTSRAAQLLEAEGELLKLEREVRELRVAKQRESAEQRTKLDQMRATTWRNYEIDREMSQLMQMFGAMGYREADALMRRYVPKHSFPWTSARAGAIWSLGHFYAGTPEPDLVGQFQSRATDNNPMDPEASEVRIHSCAALARMKSTGSAGTMASVMNSNMESIQMIIAARWAYEQLTGETLPPLPVSIQPQTGWYLEPQD